MSSAVITPEVPSKHPENVNRACEACRGLKVRCLLDHESNSGKCQRCSRSGRQCHYAAPQKRRRRKRTDTRVAELEKEVCALRSLLSKGSSRLGPEQVPEHDEGKAIEASVTHSDLVSKLDDIEESSDESDQDESPRIDPRELPNNPVPASLGINLSEVLGDGYKSMDLEAYRNTSETIHSSPAKWDRDFIDQEITSLETATELFNFYMSDLCGQLPMVVFGPSDTAAKIRREKPTLFLCIVTASAGRFGTKLYNRLHREVLRVFAQRLIIIGDKSLELVQAQLITAFWLYPPDDFKKLKFYQYIQMAAMMALEIGLGGPGGKECLLGAEDADLGAVQSNLEKRRTYLACYFMCASVAMALRRPSTLRFTSWTSECLDLTENCQYGTLYDKRFCAWVRLQVIADDCGASFGFDDPSSKVVLSESQTKLTLKRLQLLLDEWRQSLPSELMNATLKTQYHQTLIFFHEHAILDTDPEEFNPPILLKRKDPKIRPLGPAAAMAITSVIESCHEVLDLFIVTDLREVRNFPTITWVRMAYCIVLLIKISILTTSTTSELGKLLDIESLKIDFYIKNLVTRIREAAGAQEARMPSKFLKIVAKLGMWYHKRQSQLLQTVKADHQQLISSSHDQSRKATTQSISQDSLAMAEATSRATQFPTMSLPLHASNVNVYEKYGNSSAPITGNDNFNVSTLHTEQTFVSDQSSSNVYLSDMDMDYLSIYSNTQNDGSDDLNLWFPAEGMNFGYTGQDFDFNFNF